VPCNQRHVAVAAIGVDLVFDFATPPVVQALRNCSGSFATLFGRDMELAKAGAISLAMTQLYDGIEEEGH